MMFSPSVFSHGAMCEVRPTMVQMGVLLDHIMRFMHTSIRCYINLGHKNYARIERGEAAKTIAMELRLGHVCPCSSPFFQGKASLYHKIHISHFSLSKSVTIF